MQIFALFCVGESQGPGTSIEVPEVVSSGLWSLMETKFQRVDEMPDTPGTLKLVQRRDNPDVFDLCFDAQESEHYRGDRRYFLRGPATFTKQEFEQFPHDRVACEQRLDQFIRCLKTGQLK